MRLVAAILCLFLAACAGEPDGDEPSAGKPKPARLEILSGVIADTSFDGAIDFGRITVGEQRARSVVLRNAGDLPLTVEPPRVAAPFGSDLAEAAVIEGGAELPIAFRAVTELDGPLEAVVRIGSTAGRFDLRLRAEGVRCRAVLTADTLSFDAVQVGRSWTRSVEIENVGEGTCTLESARSTHPAFSVDDGRMVILPGVSAAVPVRFAPTAPSGSTSGELVLVVSGTEHTVRLSGEAVEACLFAEPGALDFGTLSTCNPFAEETISIRNDCGTAVQVRRTSFSENGFAFVLTGVNHGATLPAGGTLQFRVAALPSGVGSWTSTLAIEFEGGMGVEIPLAVAASNGAIPHEDQYFPQPPRPVDVLVVVDDTTAMTNFTSRYEAFATRLMERLRGHDYHVGVTTVSRATAPACAGAPDGRLLPLDGERPRILTRDTPDRVATLAANLAEAAPCQDPALASGTAAAWRALTDLADLADDPLHPEAADGNLGLLREDSYIQLLLLGASDDSTSESVPVWLERFASLRPTIRALPDIGVQTWTDDAGVCGGTGGNFYAQLALAAVGRNDSLCDDPLASPWPLPLAPVPDIYYLNRFPTDVDGDGAITWEAGEIAVSIGGVDVPAVSGDGKPVWTFYANSNAVRFYEDFIPHGGQLMTVSYGAGCGGDF